MTVFYLIRHAHAEWTPDEQRPLSPKGQEDAQRVADLLCGFPITGVYSSPFRRAWRTVNPLAEEVGLPVHNEPDLRERKLSDRSRVNDFFAAVRQTWEDPTYAHPGGETNAAAQRRGVAVLQRLYERHPKEHVVLSTHGNLLALMLQHYDPSVDYAFWRSLTMPDVYELQIGEDPSFTRLWQALAYGRAESARGARAGISRPLQRLLHPLRIRASLSGSHAWRSRSTVGSRQET